MKAFARLLDRLVLAPSRNGKLTLLVDYFRNTPDPDRGYALAALTDGEFAALASEARNSHTRTQDALAAVNNQLRSVMARTDHNGHVKEN